MTIITRNEVAPRTKNLIMSYEDTLREMEDFLAGKIDISQTCPETYAAVTEPTSPVDIRGPENADPDATEYSSSFGDTTSRSEVTSVTSDAEVESEFHSESSLFDSTIFPTRKRKLTSHWRDFIRPLMWRCKWTELKIKELESQALKYTRELEGNDQIKTLELHQNTPGISSKPFPISRHSSIRKPMKRRKRKLVENVTDVSSYLSNHPLFSHHDEKSDPEGSATPADDGHKELYTRKDEFVIDDNWLKDGDDSIEQVLRQIEEAQSQVHRLQNNLDMVMLKNGVKLSSSENLSLRTPYDTQTSAAQSPAFSADNGDNMSLGPIYAPENIPDFDIDDLVFADSNISGYSTIPDIIESSVGLFSAADVATHQPHIVESGENILDETLKLSKIKEEGNTSLVGIDQSLSRGQEREIKEETVSHVAVDPVACSTTPHLTVASLPRNKRKRGERKAAPGGWSLKSSGEPDSN